MSWRKNDLRMQPRKRRTNPKLEEATAAAVSFMKQKLDFEDAALFSTLKQLKPHIGDSDIIVLMTRAKEVLFKPEYLTDELKQEMGK